MNTGGGAKDQLPIEPMAVGQRSSRWDGRTGKENAAPSTAGREKLSPRP
jgi:hypothetical protein